jgi:hypothetical protein
MATKLSVYAEPTTTTSLDKKNNPANSSSPRGPRRLVDYTQYRRNIHSSSQLYHTNITPTAVFSPPRKTNLKMGLPTCFALEASLDDIILGDAKEELDAAANKANRVDFYLRVEPKSQRKPARISSLDTASSRKALHQQITTFRYLEDSTRSLGAITRRQARAASV